MPSLTAHLPRLTRQQWLIGLGALVVLGGATYGGLRWTAAADDRQFCQDLHDFWVKGNGQDQKQPMMLSGRALQKMEECNRTYPELSRSK